MSYLVLSVLLLLINAVYLDGVYEAGAHSYTFFFFFSFFWGVNIRTSTEVMYLSRMPSKLEETGHVAFLKAHLNLVTDVTETTWYEWLIA